MPGRGSGRGRHGRGRGRVMQVWLPRNRSAEDETPQTHPAGERTVPSGRDDRDPYRNQPSRGGGGAGRGFRARGRTGPTSSRHGGQPVPCQDNVALPPSAKPAVNATLKESPVIATSSPILVREPPDWYFTFYIRKDRQGLYHTYPDVRGPFKTLQGADNAIDRHLRDLEDPKMSSNSLDKLSLRERTVRLSLYWPDGTRKKCLEPLDEDQDEINLLVQALVDQYNEDHNLLGDLALQLKNVQRHQFFISKGNVYNHFNFTARTEGVVDSSFAEVQCTQGKHAEIVVSCFCVVKPDDNGRCYGCQNNGAAEMKHPNKADAYYCRGRVDEYLPFSGGYHINERYLNESVEDEEKRLRRQYECFDDPSFMAEYFPNCVKRT